MSILSTLISAGILLLYKTITGEWLLDLVPGLWKLLTSVLLIHTGGGILSSGLAVNNPTWYLCVIFICYVIFWQIQWLCQKWELCTIYWFIGLSLLGISIIDYNINLPFFNYYSGRGYAAFFCGVLLCDIYKNIPHRKLLVSSLSIIGICGTAAFINYPVFYDNPWGIFTFLLFPSVFMLSLCLDSLIKGRWWNRLGAISFEMYLWHFPLLIFLCLIKKWLKIDEKILMAFFLGVTFLFSAALYYWIELPLYRLIVNFMEKNNETV